jgi:L-threonylcarbamoyladenylate synthase
MNTLRLKIDPFQLDAAAAVEALDRAAAILRAGGLVALPTETVYGLGANALDRAAVERIFAAKQRPAWDPVIVHVAPLDSVDSMLLHLVKEIPARARRLIDAFWPGPLTLLLPRTRAVPDAVTAGRPLVGVRMPAHPVALALIRRAGVPLAAPSANLFGHTSPTTADHVLDDLDGRIDAVLDSGPTAHGLESTVLDPSSSPMRIYRPGAATAEQIQSVAGPVELFREPADAPKVPPESLPSPGTSQRHYAPKARVILVSAPDGSLGDQLAQTISQLAAEHIGIMLPAGVNLPISAAFSLRAGCTIYRWGQWADPETMARDLYSGLRALDAAGCTTIACPVPPGEGIAAAIRDRLRKAAQPE